jgi:hypothetical protein
METKQLLNQPDKALTFTYRTGSALGISAKVARGMIRG